MMGIGSYRCLVVDKPVSSSNSKPSWIGDLFSLAGLRDRRDELGGSPRFHGPLGRLAAPIQFPMLGRVFVGRIEDRMLEKAVFHRRLPCPFCAAVLYIYPRTGAITMISKDEPRPLQKICRAQVAIFENDISVRRGVAGNVAGLGFVSMNDETSAHWHVLRCEIAVFNAKDQQMISGA